MIIVRKQFPVPKDIEDEIKEALKEVPKQAMPKDIKLDSALTLYKGKGCPRCNGTGYSGRVAIAEIMMVDHDMEKIIEAGFKSAEVDEAIKKQKMIRLNQDGFIKALQGFTTVEEVMRISQE